MAELKRLLYPSFLMGGMRPAPVAELLQVDLALNRLFVLAGIVIDALAGGALQSYQVFRKLLWHI